MDTYEGGCHCGAIRFRFETGAPPAEWSVRECQCAFCRAHAARTTSDPSGRLAFEFGDADAVARYRFGLEVTDYLVCRSCGVYVGATMEVDERTVGIINLRALTHALGLPEPVAVDYDGEDPDGRSARRAERWTPVG